MNHHGRPFSGKRLVIQQKPLNSLKDPQKLADSSIKPSLSLSKKKIKESMRNR